MINNEPRAQLSSIETVQNDTNIAITTTNRPVLSIWGRLISKADNNIVRSSIVLSCMIAGGVAGFYLNASLNGSYFRNESYGSKYGLTMMGSLVGSILGCIVTPILTFRNSHYNAENNIPTDNTNETNVENTASSSNSNDTETIAMSEMSTVVTVDVVNNNPAFVMDESDNIDSANNTMDLLGYETTRF